jgi:hypothetical protein
MFTSWPFIIMPFIRPLCIMSLIWITERKKKKRKFNYINMFLFKIRLIKIKDYSHSINVFFSLLIYHHYTNIYLDIKEINQLPIFSKIRPIRHYLLTNNYFFMCIMKFISNIQWFSKNKHYFITYLYSIIIEIKED